MEKRPWPGDGHRGWLGRGLGHGLGHGLGRGLGHGRGLLRLLVVRGREREPAL